MRCATGQSDCQRAVAGFGVYPLLTNTLRYDHNNNLHYVEIVLSSELDYNRIKTDVIPLLKGARRR